MLPPDVETIAATLVPIIMTKTKRATAVADTTAAIVKKAMYSTMS